jgi:hypothetical protein
VTFDYFFSSAMKRSVTGEVIETIQGVVMTTDVSKDALPEHVRRKEMLFGETPRGINIFVDIKADNEMDPLMMQMRICACLGISQHTYESLFADMAKGKLSEDAIVVPKGHSHRVIWCPLCDDSKVGCFDITNWHVFPKAHVCDFPCCGYEAFEKAKQKTRILHELNDIVDSLSLTSSQLVDISKLMKELHDL